jgi:hypothetical protein
MLPARVEAEKSIKNVAAGKRVKCLSLLKSVKNKQAESISISSLQ